MKFYSLLFPNLTAHFKLFTIKFKDGVYETENAAEIIELQNAGFTYEPEVEVIPEQPKSKRKR